MQEEEVEQEALKEAPEEAFHNMEVVVEHHHSQAVGHTWAGQGTTIIQFERNMPPGRNNHLRQLIPSRS